MGGSYEIYGIMLLIDPIKIVKVFEVLFEEVFYLDKDKSKG
jgi:hypothetical protein